MTAGGIPSTWFTAAPHWEWLIVLYFFIGGIAGGSYFIAVLLDFFGDVLDRPVARLGYYVAFPAVVVSGILLTVDLGRPERFWHMLLQSNTWRAMFKAYSPMSLGSWALLLFGLASFLSFLAALGDAGRLRRPWVRHFRPPTIVGAIVAVIGGILGFFVAGYTGVLLTVTNRPIWADTTLLGLNFVISAASTSAALLALLAGRRRRTSLGVRALERFDAWVLVLELIALIALVASLGSLARYWLDAWGALLLVGVFIVGIILPLLLYWRAGTAGFAPATHAGLAPMLAAALVLVGGFIFRVVIVLSSQRLGA